MKKELICIICPKGCSLVAEVNGDDVKISGNACKRGEAYGINECINPVRTVTSIVRVMNREDTMVSVKTATPIAKENVFPLMNEIKKLRVFAPINVGDVIIKEVFGTDIIATKNIE